MASPRAHLRYAESDQDLAAVSALRERAFGSAAGADPWDAQARHLMLWREERLVGTVRLTLWQGAEGQAGYSAQFYDLTRFFAHFPTCLEVGRLCLCPETRDLFALQQLLGGLTLEAEKSGAAVLFGCASFEGSDPAPHLPALAHLAQTALAPAEWRPGRKLAGALGLPDTAPEGPVVLPALLRGYLSLGARVSDHVVPDRDLDTVHVFTALEPARIAPSRLKVLQSLAE